MSTEHVEWPAAAAFLCAALLGVVALLAYGSEPVRHLDAQLFVRLNATYHSTERAHATTVATFADPLPTLGLLAAACGIALLRGRSALALAALVAVAGASLTTRLLKHVLAHHKAQEILGGSGHLDGVAFPSGHATAAASIAVAFAFAVPRRLLPPTLVLGAAFALAVGYSVVVIGWHYPSDVAAGYLVAAGWGFAVLAALRALGPSSGESTPVSPPGALPSR